MVVRGLTGGGSALDGITVSQTDEGALRMVDDETWGFGTYRLEEREDAEDVPIYIRPDIYASLDPKLVWAKL